MLTASLAGAVLLGFLQGLTEFLPVSSSGHLALAQVFVDVPGDDLFFDLVLHLGTLVPAIVFFWPDIERTLRDLVGGERPFWEREGVRMAWLVVLGTIPTGVIGLGLKDVFEAQFSSLDAIGWGFLISAAWLWAMATVTEGQRAVADVAWWRAVLIGVAQGISISPSISRSGATIATALLLGLRRDVAVRLSFLMSFPSILGACLLQARDVDLATVQVGEAALGAAVSLVVGWAALGLLVRLVQQGKLAWFSVYLLALGVFSLGLAWTGA